MCWWTEGMEAKRSVKTSPTVMVLRGESSALCSRDDRNKAAWMEMKPGKAAVTEMWTTLGSGKMD